MDLGTAGGAVAVFLWGLFAGAVQRGVHRTGSQGAQLLLAFALSSVLLSPLNAPFGLANSALIFFALAVTAWFLRFPLHPLARRGVALTSSCRWRLRSPRAAP